MPLDVNMLSRYLQMIRANSLKNAQPQQDATRVNILKSTSANTSIANGINIAKTHQQNKTTGGNYATPTMILKPLPANVISKRIVSSSELGDRDYKTPIIITDHRINDSITGKPIKDTNKLTQKADINTVKQIIISSKKKGIDPYTALAIAHQETGLHHVNPFHNNNLNTTKLTNNQVIDMSLDFLKEKFALAERLGKKTEEEKIQSWNGYGKIGQIKDDPKVEDDAAVREWYGIDVTKTPINFNKNPVYGKRIIDIRENIIKKNPELIKLIESTN